MNPNYWFRSSAGIAAGTRLAAAAIAVACAASVARPASAQPPASMSDELLSDEELQSLQAVPGEARRPRDDQSIKGPVYRPEQVQPAEPEPQYKWWDLKNRLFNRGVDDAGRMHAAPKGEAIPQEAAEQLEQAQQDYEQGRYSKAARSYKRLSKKHKKTAVAEEALYRQAEALFAMDKLPAAQDAYAKLLVEFPTTRYLPQAVQRIYDIAHYWLEDSQLRSQGLAGKHNWFTRSVNLFDKTRPILDTNGRAIEAIEIIQQYDPLGPLSDDAGMMAGAHSFSSQDFIKAAGYYEQVVTDQPKSDHAARACLLGAQAYLRAYQGPGYDSRDLDDAERMTRMALGRGPELTAEQRQRLEKDLRLIYLERARRDYVVAEEYRQMRQPKAAVYYYSLVAKRYPDTDWARRAQEEINRIQTSSDEGMFHSLASFFSRSTDVTEPVQAQAESLTPPTPNLETAQPAASSGTQPPASAPEQPRSMFSRLPFMSR